MLSNTLKILFITPYPFGEAPSQRFRFEQYLQFLLKSHYNYKFASFLDVDAWQKLYKPGNIASKLSALLKGYMRRALLMFNLSKYDYIFIHREAAPLGPPVFEWIIAKIWRKKIIYDFDDAIWLPNTSKNNRWAAGLKWHKKVADICRWSYKISCGNSYLADFARKFNSNVVIQPTTIDTLDLHNPDLFVVKKVTESKEIPIIGWTGSHSTMPYLKLIEPALQHLEKSHTFIFRVISNHPPEMNLQCIDYVPWSKSKEIEDLLNIDIGLMPLEDDIWAKGKCGFKCLQYMALGIPALISPVGFNNELILHGEEGYFCQKDEDWINFMKELLQNPSGRKKMGEKGRKKVVKHYSILSNKSNFMNLFR